MRTFLLCAAVAAAAATASVTPDFGTVTQWYHSGATGGPCTGAPSLVQFRYVGRCYPSQNSVSVVYGECNVESGYATRYEFGEANCAGGAMEFNDTVGCDTFAGVYMMCWAGGPPPITGATHAPGAGRVVNVTDAALSAKRRVGAASAKKAAAGQRVKAPKHYAVDPDVVRLSDGKLIPGDGHTRRGLQQANSRGLVGEAPECSPGTAWCDKRNRCLDATDAC